MHGVRLDPRLDAQVAVQGDARVRQEALAREGDHGERVQVGLGVGRGGGGDGGEVRHDERDELAREEGEVVGREGGWGRWRGRARVGRERAAAAGVEVVVVGLDRERGAAAVARAAVGRARGGRGRRRVGALDALGTRAGRRAVVALGRRCSCSAPTWVGRARLALAARARRCCCTASTCCDDDRRGPAGGVRALRARGRGERDRCRAG